MEEGWGNNSTDFESLFRSIVDVTRTQVNQRVRFLKLHLGGSALQFFSYYRREYKGRFGTRVDLELTITALKFNMKLNHKTESPEEFLANLQDLPLKAYPTPVYLRGTSE